MGKGTDCLRLTLRPEMQVHCRWGSSDFRLMHHDDRPTPKGDDVKPAGESNPALPQVNQSMMVRKGVKDFSVLPERSGALDFYIPPAIPPAPKNPLANFAQPSVTLFQTRLGTLQLRVGIWATPTGFSTETDRPISVAMEQWKNGGVPFPSGVGYMLFGGGQIRF